jgi:D-inositol-3-phosphate glycosyltransferase
VPPETVTEQVHAFAVAIEELRLPEAKGGPLLDFRLTSPEPRSTSEELAVEVKGWILPKRSRAEAIELVCQGEVVRELAVETSRSGPEGKPQESRGGPSGSFFGVIGALRLPPRFRLDVVARLEDGSRAPLAEVIGRRSSIGPERGWEGPRGAFISSPSGRTGTTWIVQLLGEHPSIVAHPPFGVEPRPASYWIEVAMALTEPGSYKRILRPSMDHERWWLGEWPDADRGPIDDDDIRRYLGQHRSREIAAWARDQIVDFYEVVGAKQAKADATVFVEKAPMGRRRLELLGDLLPASREIAMFRDPRDTLCSILAYAAQNPRAALVSREPGPHDEYVEELAASFRGLLGECREREGETLVVRYEDLVRDPVPTLEAILDHLDVETSGTTVAAMVQGAAGESGRLERHRTSGDVAEQSIGRWQRDMDPGLRSRSAEIFRDVLDDLGYAGATAVAIPRARAEFGPDAAAAVGSGPAAAGSDEPEELASLRGVIRAVDSRRWRHVYTVGEQADEGLSEPSELGALAGIAGPDRVAVYLEADGRVVTETYEGKAARPSLNASIRWILAPLRWRDTGWMPRRLRRVLGRLRRRMRRAWAKRRKDPLRERPVGYLYSRADVSRLPLFSAIHPITGDQLLSTRLVEADELGYRGSTRLGYLVAAAPLTRVLGWRRTALPWAYRLGKDRRTGPAGARGALAQPADSRIPRDALRISGWAVLARESVSRVDVLVDGALVGQARIGIQRPNLEVGGNPEAATAGFDLRVPPSSLPSGVSRIKVEAVVVGENGSQFTLAPQYAIELTSPITALSEDEEAGAALLRGDLERTLGKAAFAPNDDSGWNRAPGGDRIRVAAFAHNLDTGGAQRTLFEQLKRLQETGDFDATVVAPRPGPLQRQLEQVGIPVHVSGKFPIAGLSEYEGRVAEIAAWVKAQQADVVIANTLGAFIGVDVATRLGLPSAWIIHESYELPVWWQMIAGPGTHPDFYVRSRCSHALRHADAAIFPADATRMLFQPYIEESRMFTAPCGVEFADIDAYRQRVDIGEVRQKLGVGRDSNLILSLGIMEPRKGQSVLARAWARLHRQHPNAELALVGATDTPYCTGVERYVEAAGIGRSCRLLPPTRDPWAWHAAADVFVLSSDIESAPVVLAEAMAFETPAIATDVFGIPELITNRRDGFLCEPNDVDDLARTLDRVLRLDREQLRAVAVRGSRRAREHHDPARFVDGLSRLLQGLVRDRQRTPTWA